LLDIINIHSYLKKQHCKLEARFQCNWCGAFSHASNRFLKSSFSSFFVQRGGQWRVQLKNDPGN